MSMDKAKEKLTALKKRMDESTTKPVLPKYIEVLNPFKVKDARKIAYFKRINKNVKASFKENQSPSVQLELEVEKPPTGANAGNLWHTSLNKCIKNPEKSKNEIGKAVIDAVKYWLPGDLILLQSEFTLNGYMKFKEENEDGCSEISFWSGIADAIGWYEDNYVIVEWKVVDILKFWETDRRAYGVFLHQCLVYARLLKLHLHHPKLPNILIVPISSNTGKDIIPALFSDFPEECKDEIEMYEWFTELKPAILSLPSSIFNNVDKICGDDGRVDKDIKLSDVLKKLKDCTVKQLLDTLGPGSLDCTIGQLLRGLQYDKMNIVK